MNPLATLIAASSLAVLATSAAAADAPWWNTQWRVRTTVTRATPFRDMAPRPVEVAIDFPRLLRESGIAGEFDPRSVRVVRRETKGPGTEVPSAYRSELDPTTGRQQPYVIWTAQPRSALPQTHDVYFDAKQRNIPSPDYPGDALPPQNLLVNPGFDAVEADAPVGWQAEPAALVRFGRFAHTTDAQSLNIVVDETTPPDARRDASISQTVDVARFAGHAILFQCDLLAERSTYGAPVSIELQQFRPDGSRLPVYAIHPRWLSLELAQGQLVRFSERGRLSPEAATCRVMVRMRCYARDADTRAAIKGPESHYTVWLDRVVLRPGERWPWPGLSHAGFVEGALHAAPVNRAFEFTGQRRLAFNGASDGTLSSGRYNPDPHSVHWGLEEGTIEFWCRPSWDSSESRSRVLFDSKAYMHRLQARIQSRGRNELQFMIADAGCKPHRVKGPARLTAGRWHHIVATWSFPKAHLQLFLDGKRVGSDGPGPAPWPSSLVAEGGPKKEPGMGVTGTDTRSLPMQAFIGGDHRWRKSGSAEAAIDEFRVSDLVRHAADFVPSRDEFLPDDHTRALFHFDNECDGVHHGDDQVAHGHLACELPPREEAVPLEVLTPDGLRRQMVVVKPHAPAAAFEANRAENRMTVTRPLEEPPDPRFLVLRDCQVERTVNATGEEFVLNVAGDYAPLMRSVTFTHADAAAQVETLLPRWRANDNVVPFSAPSLKATLAPNASGDAEKAFIAFKYALAVTNYYDAHFCETLPNGLHRPRVSYSLVKGLNMYPFDQCGPMNHMLRKLFLSVGISSTNASGTHHQFEQAFYDGSMRLFDLSGRVYWLHRDGASVLSRRGMEADPYLKLRQGGDANAWLRGRKSRATFGGAERPHCMDFPLRPGERVSVCWHNEGRWFEVAGKREPIPLAKIPPYFGNGAIVYGPTAGEATVLDNVAVDTKAGELVVRAKDASKPACLIYRLQCPYIFSDGRVSGSYVSGSPNAIALSLSFDQGKHWTPVWTNAAPKGSLDVSLLSAATGRYAYWLKADLVPNQGASLVGLQVRTTFVASPLALPGKLSLGANRIRFVAGPVKTPVRTSCQWTERHKAPLGVSLNTLSYYLNGDQAHRNVLVVAPGRKTPLRVTLQGEAGRASVAIEGLPAGWTTQPGRGTVVLPDAEAPLSTEHVIRADNGLPGHIHGFGVVVNVNGSERRIQGQVLVADACLVREAEQADELPQAATVTALPSASGGRVVELGGSGALAFNLTAPRKDTFAVWLRARWKRGSSTRMHLGIDEEKPRTLRAAAMIGFTDWTAPNQANTKMFAHFGEQYAHWSWYRIPDVVLARGRHRLALSASRGACFDAIAVLPQNPVMDRAAMNLFQNWNYAPWNNPF